MFIILIILCLLVAVIMLLIIGIRVIAPMWIKTKHKIKTPGIDKLEMIEIGDIKQALYFRGVNKDNPVILFIHGGPGNSEMPFIHLFQYDWENDFTVVHWDQRNVGKTYLANDSKAVLETMSAERVLKDVHDVTKYVKKKLNKDKLIILGHSWGSILGTMAVQTYPEDYSAYIGVGQIINFANTERFGYENVLKMAKESGKQKDIKALEAIAPYPTSKLNSNYMEPLKVVKTYQSQYGLSVNLNFGKIISILATPYYSFKDLKNSFIFRPFDVLAEQGDIIRYLLEESDVKKYGTVYQVPVYYLSGENDNISPPFMAKEFLDEIKAPDKQFFSISNAAHMPFFENKKEFTRILLEKIKPKI